MIKDAALSTHIPVFSSLQSAQDVLIVLETLAMTTQPCKIKYYLLCKFREYIKSAHFDMNAFFYILFLKYLFHWE